MSDVQSFPTLPLLDTLAAPRPWRFMPAAAPAPEARTVRTRARGRLTGAGRERLLAQDRCAARLESR